MSASISKAAVRSAGSRYSVALLLVGIAVASMTASETKDPRPKVEGPPAWWRQLEKGGPENPADCDLDGGRWYVVEGKGGCWYAPGTDG